MENNINIAEILKDYSKGTKLYSPLFGKVTLEEVNINIPVPIKVIDSLNNYNCFFKTGLYYNRANAECLLFPSSEIRDWTKFFKRGDVVCCNDGNMYAIFEGWANDDYTKFNTTINFYVANASFGREEVCYTDLYVKASDEERATFIANAEKHYKGKYNPDTLQVEPVKPECPFKPFDKVLVRNYDNTVWFANYFSHYKDNNGYHYACIDDSYIFCIPYEGNEHLLGTTDPYTEGCSE